MAGTLQQPAQTSGEHNRRHRVTLGQEQRSSAASLPARHPPAPPSAPEFHLARTPLHIPAAQRLRRIRPCNERLPSPLGSIGSPSFVSMSSAIHYRLKHGTQLGDWSSIHFDGYHYTVFELKQRIIYAEHMLATQAEAGSFDLLLTNSTNGDEYRDDIFQIHRNSSLIVKKIPAANPQAAAKLWIPPGSLGPDWNKSTSTWTPEGGPNSNLTVLGNRAGAPTAGGEDDGMAAAMASAGKYASAPRGRSGPFNPIQQRGALTAQSRPPTGYICHRCKQGGHYIQFWSVGRAAHANGNVNEHSL